MKQFIPDSVKADFARLNPESGMPLFEADQLAEILGKPVVVLIPNRECPSLKLEIDGQVFTLVIAS